MSFVENAIENTIESPAREFTVSEAQKVLQECGILTKKNNVKKAYKDIIVKVRPDQDERKQL